MPSENGPDDSRPSATALESAKSIGTVLSPSRPAIAVLGVLHRAEYCDGEAIDPEPNAYEDEPELVRSTGNSRRLNPSGLGVGSCLACRCAVYGDAGETGASGDAKESGR